MAEIKKEECDCALPDRSCCKVESVISIDERGQMVLPKEVRDKAKINGGDKFAVISWEKEGRICCISLLRVDDFAGMVKGLLGPVMEAIIPGQTGK
ncbi:HgcAB-associated protein HgcC [Chloroflexota bacterium]